MENKKTIKQKLRRFLLEKRGDSHEYGCVMLSLNIPEKEWDGIQLMIDDDDIYTQEGDMSYGREDDPHITLLYGLHDDIKDEEIKEIVEKIDRCQVNLKKISIFEADKYDVVKFDIIDQTKNKLSKINKEFVKLPHTTSFPNYHPHCTIAYVKKGAGRKYIKMLPENKQISVESNIIRYSKADDSEIKFKV